MENIDKKIKKWKDEAYLIQAELEKNRDKKLRRNKKRKKEEGLKVKKKNKYTKNRKYGGRNSTKIS